MSSSSPRRSSFKQVAVLRLVGVLAFVACCHNVITRYQTVSTLHDVSLQRKLTGATLWGSEGTDAPPVSLWGFGGITTKGNASNEEGKSLALDPQTGAFKASSASNEQEVNLEPKPQTIMLPFMPVPTTNEQDDESIWSGPESLTIPAASTINAQEKSFGSAFQTILPIAVTTSNEQEASAELDPQIMSLFSAAVTSNAPESGELEPPANLSGESTTK
jgi:hypothetical protein